MIRFYLLSCFFLLCSGFSNCFQPHASSLRRKGHVLAAGDREAYIVTADGIQLVPSVTITPSTALVPRDDNFLEKSLIFVLSYLLLQLENRQDLSSMVFPQMSFADFTLFTKSLLTRSNRVTLRVKIIALLSSIIPEQLREGFKGKYKTDPQWISEKSSEWMSFGLLAWLVGPVERFDIQQPQANTSTPSTADVIADSSADTAASGLSTAKWTSGAKLVECRYLMESKCKATCLYLCKGPTQEFFRNELGLPLYMKPDFATSSCEMQFGVVPPAENEDPAFLEECFTACPSKTEGSKRALC